MPTLAVYPGSFDPLTNGHVDIITRGARLFDRIIVAILVNAEKSPLFTMAERVEIARAVFKEQPNVEVDTFDGLLVDYVERRKAQVIVRGLRAVSDFEFEFQMALMNQRLNAKIETVFMMPAEQYTYISSRLIKEVFSLGGRVHGLVPDMVEERLREKRRGRQGSAIEGSRRQERVEARVAGLTQRDRTTRIASSPTMKVTATVDRLRREGVEVIDFGAGEPDFPTPDADQAGRARGDRRELHEVHAGVRHRRAEARDLRSLPARLRRRVHGSRGHRQRRRQAGAVQHGAGAVRAGRRGHHARAVLADADRAGQARRRDAGARAHARRGRLRDPRRADSRRRHAADARHHHQLAVQSDRRADLGGRAGDDRRGSRAPRHLGRPRSLLREADLRRRAAQPAGRARDALPRPGGHLRIGVEGVRDDRLALRLDDRPGGGRRRVSALQSHATSNVVSITQKAVVAALTGSQEPVRAMLDEYRTRRDQLSEWLTADPRLRCRKPAGAFYLFVDVSEVLSVDGFRTSTEFARGAARRGARRGHAGRGVRRAGLRPISYATSMENLREGSRRLLEFVAQARRRAGRLP